VNRATTVLGRQAEAAAAQYLGQRGYKILEQNWRTRWCEIDLVAERAGVIYFIEVKYRRHTNQGGGLAALTPRKLKQMDLAARLWVSTHDYDGDYELAAVEVGGPDLGVTAFIEGLS